MMQRTPIIAVVSTLTFLFLPKAWPDDGVWTPIRGPVAADGEIAAVQILAVDPSDPLRLYASDTAEGGLFATDDGGVRWTRLSNDRVTQLLVDADVPQRMYAIVRGPERGGPHLLDSRTAGLRWTP